MFTRNTQDINETWERNGFGDAPSWILRCALYLEFGDCDAAIRFNYARKAPGYFCHLKLWLRVYRKMVCVKVNRKRKSFSQHKSSEEWKKHQKQLGGEKRDALKMNRKDFLYKKNVSLCCKNCSLIGLLFLHFSFFIIFPAGRIVLIVSTRIPPKLVRWQYNIYKIWWSFSCFTIM